MWQLTARRCCHRIVAPSPTSSPAGPKRSADSSGAAITAAPLLHVFHSCRNRACPKCHAEQTQAWLAQPREEMLPVPYFHVTVTVPEELRAALRRHQIDGYGALMKAAAEAIIVLARDPRWVGGTVGVLAVLHTWTQRLVFHPHVHCLVTGGGLSDDGATWHPAGKTFLFPKTALATLARARFRDAFAKLC